MHVPAAPGIEPGTRDLSVLFAEVVAQLGIEPMATRFLVVALTTKLLGHATSTLYVYPDRRPTRIGGFFGSPPPFFRLACGWS